MKKCLSVILSVLMLLSVCAVSVSAADECQHSYVGSYIAPTCVEDGYYLYVCGNCGDYYKETENAPAALGHNFGEWYELDKAECIYEGHEQRDCLRCGGSEIKTYPILGHIDENANGKCDRCNQPMKSETTFAPFDWLVAFFQAVIQFFKDIFA